MTTYLWSSLANGAVLAFDPASDVLHFTDDTIAVSAVTVTPGAAAVIFNYGGKAITVNTALSTLTTGNITFAGGSLLVIGDNSTGNAADDWNNWIDGAAGGDQLFGLGGDDRLAGFGGDDYLDGGNGNDLLAGGLGNDTLVGGAGNDRFSNELSDAPGDDVLYGGPGDDYLNDWYGSSTFHGGDGADRLLITEGAAYVIDGGPGADVYEFVNVPSTGDLAAVVTDFVPGADGDIIDLDRVFFFLSAGFHIGESGTYSGGNPFAPQLGYLRLSQSGPHTFLQFDFDGAAGSGTWRTLLTLQNVTASALTAHNLDGIPPDGSAVPGQVINGTDGADTLDGGFFDDQLFGLAGDDVLDGKGGDDLLEGGDGNDLFQFPGPGNDTLNGGAGDDVFNDTLGDNFLSGGDGADLFVALSQNAGSFNVTGGAGQDIHRFNTNPFELAFEYVVTDFATGSGGDLLDFDQVLEVSALYGGYADGNPFAPALGFLRLQQSGSDTVVQLDFDGAAGTTYGWITLATLLNVSAPAVIAANVAGGFPPNLSILPGAQISGTSGSDTLWGTFAAEEIYGLAGNDSLHGYGGNDTLDGGAGQDFFSGGFGNDLIIGSDGDDSFHWERPGLAAWGDDHLIGGAGDDVFWDNAGSNVLEGGDGDDQFNLQYIAANSNTATGGAGRDEYRMAPITNVAPVFAVTDFAAGPGGDRIDVNLLLAHSSEQFWDGTGDPFAGAEGFLRLVQAGADTLLQWDLDGAAGSSYNWVTQITLLDLDKNDLTSDNFTGRLIVGTAGNDTLLGGIGNDTIQALAGDDILDGSLGADSMQGGSGKDLYYVDNAGDVVVETSNAQAPELGDAGNSWAAEALAGLEGFIDTVIAAVSYSLQNAAFVENLTLNESGTATSGTGNELDNVLIGNALSNALAGLAGMDTLDAGAGDDTLDGGAGLDVATFSGSRASYAVGKEGVSIAGPDGSDVLSNIERLQFADEKGVAFDLGAAEAAGNTVRVIGVAFDAENIIPEFVGIGLDLFNSGYTMLQVCQLALGTPLWLSLAGSSSNEAFVNAVYENITGSAPSPGERDFYVGLLVGSGGTLTQAQLLEIAANTDANAQSIDLVGLQQSGVEFA